MPSRWSDWQRVVQPALGLAMCLIFLVTQVSFAAARDQTVQIQVRSSQDFAAFLGVNTHFSQRTSLYLDWKRSAAHLHYLGIGAIRDGCTASPATLAVYRALVHDGVRLAAVYDGETVEQTIAAARELAMLKLGALLAIEGPNEVNNWPVTYQGRTTKFAPIASSGTFLPAARFQAALYAAVRRDTALAKVPVWHLTDGGAEPDDVGLQFLTIPKGSGTRMPDGTVFADVANIHVYRSGGEQAQGIRPDDDRFQEEVANEYQLTWGGTLWGEKSYKGYSAAKMKFPVVVTESGYHSNAPASADAVDRETQAKNLLNAILDAWADGYRAFFVYELYDEASDSSDEGNYGLFDVNGRAKPAALAIHALTKLLSDHREPHATHLMPDVKVMLSGLPETARWVGLQGSDGLLRLIVWNNARDWDATLRQPVLVPPTPVTIRLDKVWPRVRLFDPTRGLDPVARQANVRQVTLPLTDHPLIVELSERAAD